MSEAEFDGKTAQEFADKTFAETEIGIRSGEIFVKACRHQHSLDQAALLKARDEIARLKSESSAYCAYCSFELPAGAKVSEIHEHTKTCEFHPLAEMRRELLNYDLRLTKERTKCERLKESLEELKLHVIPNDRFSPGVCKSILKEIEQALSGEAE